MKKKIVGILVCMLMITTTLSATSAIKLESTFEIRQPSTNATNGITFGITFNQIDFLYDNDSLENSHWGHIEVDIEEFTEHYRYEEGYLNVYTDAGWVVQNLFIDVVEGMKYLSMYFDLGVPPGENVEVLYAFLNFTPEPFVYFEDGPREDYPVGTVKYSAWGVGEIDFVIPEEIARLEFEPTGETYDYTKPNLDANENVQAACNQCFPMAIANSLQYLENRYTFFSVPHNHVPGLKGDNSLVGQLDTACNRFAPSRTSGSGVWFVPMIEGKFKYLANNGLANQLIHRHQGYGWGGSGNQLPTGDFTHAGITSIDESVNGKVTFEWIEEQLKKCEDVEVAVRWGSDGGHAVRVFGCGKTLGTPWLRYKHDRLQTNFDPTDSLGLEEVLVYVEDLDGDGMMNWDTVSNEIYFALAESAKCCFEVKIQKFNVFNVKAIVTETCNVSHTNIPWEITISGGLWFPSSPASFTGTIPSMSAGGKATIRSGFIFGLGCIDITVTVDDCEPVTVAALIIGPFVIVW